MMLHLTDVNLPSLENTFLYEVYTSHVTREVTQYVLQEATYKISRARMERDILKVIFREDNLSFDAKLACLSIIVHSDAFDAFWEALKHEAGLRPEKCSRLRSDIDLVLSLPARGEALFRAPLSALDNIEGTSSSNSDGDRQDSSLCSDRSSSASTSPAGSEELNRIFGAQADHMEEDDSDTAGSSSDESMTDPRTEEEIELDKLLNPLSYYLPNPQPPSEALQKLFYEKLAERQANATSRRTALQEAAQNQALDKPRVPHAHESEQGDGRTSADKETPSKPAFAGNRDVHPCSTGLPVNEHKRENIPPRKLVGILRRPSLEDGMQSPKVPKRVRIDLSNVEMN